VQLDFKHTSRACVGSSTSMSARLMAEHCQSRHGITISCTNA
jgi:hypothetical protein